jgi:hypothetical protein
MARRLGLGMTLAFCFISFGCFASSENTQRQFQENDEFWCQEQVSRVTERDDPQWQSSFESCMQTGQIQ